MIIAAVVHVSYGDKRITFEMNLQENQDPREQDDETCELSFSRNMVLS